MSSSKLYVATCTAVMRMSVTAGSRRRSTLRLSTRVPS
uniref:Uncharacterized protein n=1 Tax=Arundo donax TaxID=35708 RepID=A0A0A9EWS0_ARUDO